MGPIRCRCIADGGRGGSMSYQRGADAGSMGDRLTQGTLWLSTGDNQQTGRFRRRFLGRSRHGGALDRRRNHPAHCSHRHGPRRGAAALRLFAEAPGRLGRHARRHGLCPRRQRGGALGDLGPATAEPPIAPNLPRNRSEVVEEWLRRCVGLVPRSPRSCLESDPMLLRNCSELCSDMAPTMLRHCFTIVPQVLRSCP